MQRKKETQINSHNILALGRNSIAQAIDGLSALSDALDARFAEAVECLHAVQGRVIITGMGKSGHVARKIAATMASTGTPAQFVHPGEASHGDLGMITAKDAVLALSNSGETKELSDVIHHCKRFSVPLIALVRRKQSMLVEAADIPIVLPEVPEAGPVDAPTTSTTMMMAYGDALAVALMELNGFTKDDFSVFHPGGKLGAAFLRVRDLMHDDVKELPLVERTMPMNQVLLEMTAKTFGCAGVVDDQGVLLGIITDGDLRRHMNDELLESNADEIMTGSPLTIPPTMMAAEALGIMNEKKITCLFVEDEKKPVGILHIHDCLRAGVA